MGTAWELAAGKRWSWSGNGAGTRTAAGHAKHPDSVPFTTDPGRAPHGPPPRQSPKEFAFQLSQYLTFEKLHIKPRDSIFPRPFAYNDGS